MDEPCSIQASYPSYIKKNETTEIVSQSLTFWGHLIFRRRKRVLLSLNQPITLSRYSRLALMLARGERGVLYSSSV